MFFSKPESRYAVFHVHFCKSPFSSVNFLRPDLFYCLLWPQFFSGVVTAATGTATSNDDCKDNNDNNLTTTTTTASNYNNNHNNNNIK